jgi:hypothetical protein
VLGSRADGGGWAEFRQPAFMEDADAVGKGRCGSDVVGHKQNCNAL